MGKVLRALFGGSKQEQKSQSTAASQQSQASASAAKSFDLGAEEFQGLRGPSAIALEQLLGQRAGDPMSGIPQSGFNEMVAPINGVEEAFLQFLQQDLNAPRRDLLDQTIQGNFLPGQQGSNPFLEAAIQAAQRPTLQGLGETLERTLPGRFTQAGQFTQPEGSSAFDRAAAIATRGAADAVADIATKISSANFEGERGRQQEAIQLSQADVDTTIKNLQAQALPRLIQDLGIERGLQEYQFRVTALLEALSQALQSGAPVVGSESTSASFGQGTSESQSTAEGRGTSTGGIIPGISGMIGAFKK